MLVKVDDLNSFQQEVETYSGKVLIKFEADWCSPCRAMAPVVEDLARQHPDVKVVVVDIEGDGLDAVLQKYNVRAVPTFVQIKEGLSVKTAIGTISRAELSALLV